MKKDDKKNKKKISKIVLIIGIILIVFGIILMIVKSIYEDKTINSDKDLYIYSGARYIGPISLFTGMGVIIWYLSKSKNKSFLAANIRSWEVK